MLIFNEVTPSFIKLSKYVSRSIPLVVIAISFISGIVLIFPINSSIPFLVRGSPPVILTFRIPSFARISTVL